MPTSMISLLIIYYVGTEVYAHISEFADYAASITALDNVYFLSKTILSKTI